MSEEKRAIIELANKLIRFCHGCDDFNFVDKVLYHVTVGIEIDIGEVQDER